MGGFLLGLLGFLVGLELLLFGDVWAHRIFGVILMMGLRDLVRSELGFDWNWDLEGKGMSLVMVTEMVVMTFRREKWRGKFRIRSLFITLVFCCFIGEIAQMVPCV